MSDSDTLALTYRSNFFQNLLHLLLFERTIYSFCKAIKKRNYNALESLLAMAFNSASYKFLIQKLDNHCEYPNHILRRVKQWLSIPMLRPLLQVL